jgi:hypothetical protein
MKKRKKNTLSENNLYGGIKILSPEGAILCRCNQKKADWYLSRHIADKKADDCIVLRFKPKGFGDPYLIHSKENICVVCGSDKELTKHHVVPRSYRQHFPVQFKTHLSHDCVLLCVDCHEKYELSSRERQNTLARRYNVPLCGEKTNPIMSKAFGSIKALLDYKNKIPSERKEHLWGNIERHFGYRPKEEDLPSLLQTQHMANS